jgi:hypothetical protein
LQQHLPELSAALADRAHGRQFPAVNNLLSISTVPQAGLRFGRVHDCVSDGPRVIVR